MAGTAKQGTVALKMVSPVIPKGANEKAMQDLTWMGCHGLMTRPWCIKYEKIVQELQRKQANQWAKTIRWDPDLWTATFWRKVYGFPIKGEGMATRAERYAEEKFANSPHPKDGYSLPECTDPRARRVLEFLFSILYPKKPAKVTITVGNTIFGTYTGEWEVDWVLVIQDVVRRLLIRVGKSKPTPICLYLLHLYIAHDVVHVDDKKVYMVGKSFMRHEVDPDEEEESSGSESLEQESLTSKEIRELQQQ